MWSALPDERPRRRRCHCRRVCVCVRACVRAARCRCEGRKVASGADACSDEWSRWPCALDPALPSWHLTHAHTHTRKHILTAKTGHADCCAHLCVSVLVEVCLSVSLSAALPVTMVVCEKCGVSPPHPPPSPPQASSPLPDASLAFSHDSLQSPVHSSIPRTSASRSSVAASASPAALRVHPFACTIDLAYFSPTRAHLYTHTHTVTHTYTYSPRLCLKKKR